MSLIDVLTLQAIQKLADARTFERGKAYFHVAKRIERTEVVVTKALQHLWELVRAEEAPNAKRLPSFPTW